MSWKKWLALGIVVVYLSTGAGVAVYSLPLGVDVSDAQLEHTRLGLSFPPMSDEWSRTFTARAARHLNLSLVRFAEHWGHREPTPGAANWAPLERRLAFCQDNGLEILLTIQSDGPDWACSATEGEHNARSCVFTNLTAFETYLRALFPRLVEYNVTRVQFGNEWASEWWYAGTAEQFVAAHERVVTVARELAPNVEIVLGGFASATARALAAYTGFLDEYVDEEGNRYTGAELAALFDTDEARATIARINHVLNHTRFDVLDVHLYDDPAHFDEVVAAFRALVPGVPVISTEFGGPNLLWEPPTQDHDPYYHARHLRACIEALDAANVTEAYFFKLVQGGSASAMHAASGAFNGVLMMKPTYYVLQAYGRGAVVLDWEYGALYTLIGGSLLAGTLTACFGVGIVVYRRKTKNEDEDEDENESPSAGKTRRRGNPLLPG